MGAHLPLSREEACVNAPHMTSSHLLGLSSNRFGERQQLSGRGWQRRGGSLPSNTSSRKARAQFRTPQEGLGFLLVGLAQAFPHKPLQGLNYSDGPHVIGTLGWQTRPPQDREGRHLKLGDARHHRGARQPRHGVV